MSLRDRFNVWHRGIHLAVALIDACPLRCPSCSVGNRWVGSGERMNFDLFRRILEKVDRETKVRSFTPHIWGEPLLHPELPAFLHEAKRRGYPHVVASTTLNKMNCKLRDVMQSGLDELVVSWSGWDNYGKHHKGGRIGVVLTNMEWLSAVKGSARVTIRFHKYKDNLHEVDKARSFSQSLGFTFTEVNAYYVNLENRVYGTLSAIDRETMQTFVEDVDTIAERHAGVD
jgi:MoaA/NifB/PqqE/SkfB family radical SAM enzyme